MQFGDFTSYKYVQRTNAVPISTQHIPFLLHHVDSRSDAKLAKHNFTIYHWNIDPWYRRANNESPAQAAALFEPHSPAVLSAACLLT